jgi:hypothetical protein
MATALALFGSSAKLQPDATSISLAIYDTNLKNATPLHLRAFSQQCASRADDGEDVEYTPEEFAGIKIKVPHPSEHGKQVSVTVRSKGSVKIYMGRPGVEYERALATVIDRLKRLLNLT